MAATSMGELSHESATVLRAIVTGPDSGFANMSDSTVRLFATHSNLAARIPELRLDLHNTITTVKEKLYTHFGTACGSMKLILMDPDGNKLCAMLEDDKKLGFYGVKDGFGIHVVDLDPTSITTGGQLENLSLVEKYVMSEEDYNKRDNTYRKYKEQKLREDPTWTYQRDMARRMGKPLPEPQPEKDPEYMSDIAATMRVGGRCEVNPGGRRGEVKFIGKVPELHPGFWIGVAFDEPQGKNDGSVKGVRYFECMESYGGFLRPNCVTMGDFPPLDDFDFSDDGEI
mmetsp:Transcript_16452/g.35632  ORF Transcript_16452/g.35632 Transcript_16452/m.35632 type:complete len:285 (+) Transcript_16452:1-855(+)